MNHQDVTLQTYKDNFETYKQKTPSDVSGEFIDHMDDLTKHLPDNAQILEIGSAHGRDARYLRGKGHLILCTDVIPQALKELSTDQFETAVYDFREAPKKEWENHFDGVLAKAVYLHATQEIFESSLDALGKCLKKNGIFCITFKLGSGEELETGKLGGERYFKYYSEQELIDIITKHNQYKLFTVSKTNDQKWIQLILERI